MKSMDRLNSANRIVIIMTRNRLSNSLFFVPDILMLFLLSFLYFYLTSFKIGNFVRKLKIIIITQDDQNPSTGIRHHRLGVKSPFDLLL